MATIPRHAYLYKLAGAFPALRAVATRTRPLHTLDLHGGEKCVLLARSGEFRTNTSELPEIETGKVRRNGMRARMVWRKARKWIAVSFLLVLVLFGWFFCRSMAFAMQSASSPHVMKMITLAMHLYAEDNSGWFPDANGIAGLRKLLQHGGITPSQITCSPEFPVASADAEVDEVNTSYIYIGGHGVESPPHTIVLIEKPSLSLRHGRIMVGLADGRIVNLADITR